jgi:hypothetical protein
MEIQLNQDVEQMLETQAAAYGRPVHEYVASVLSRFVQATADPRHLGEGFEIKTYEDAVAWILSRNPNLPKNRPEDTDWQQLKNEGRRY